MSKPYCEKLKDPRWQKKRLEVMQRDEFTCRDCGAKDKTLNVHHCHYSKGGPWATPDKFLLTLCEDCHERRQKAENELKEAFAELLCGMRLTTVEREGRISTNFSELLVTIRNHAYLEENEPIMASYGDLEIIRAQVDEVRKSYRHLSAVLEDANRNTARLAAPEDWRDHE